MSASSIRSMWIPAIAGALLVACSEPPPPANPSSGELPLKMSTAKPAELPPPEEVPSAEPSASAVASASAAPSTPPPSSGDSRPPVLKMDPKEISDTFGISPGAKLELGEEGDLAIFRIPENSLQQGVNVTFKLDPKAKAGGAVVGKIYHLRAVIPPSGESSLITTNGRPFVLQLPAGNKKDANLAIGEIGAAKVTWRVIAPIKIDDVTSTATYELNEMNDYYLHVTTRPVTPAK